MSFTEAPEVYLISDLPHMVHSCENRKIHDLSDSDIKTKTNPMGPYVIDRPTAEASDDGRRFQDFTLALREGGKAIAAEKGAPRSAGSRIGKIQYRVVSLYGSFQLHVCNCIVVLLAITKAVEKSTASARDLLRVASQTESGTSRITPCQVQPFHKLWRSYV